nr:hypothetical protein HUO10_003017 [Paraburkholderia busanensis]
MTPFSVVLRTLRARFEIGQGQFAERLGYRQGYISALECGTKLPKDTSLVPKIVQLLKLAPDEEASLQHAYNISRRFDFPPSGAPVDSYGLCAQLFEMLPTLSHGDIRFIRGVLDGIRQGKSPSATLNTNHAYAIAQEIPM